MSYWEYIELRKKSFIRFLDILDFERFQIQHGSVRSNIWLTEDATGDITRIKRSLFRDRQVLEHLSVWYETNYRSRPDLNYIVWNSERKPFLTQGTNKQSNDFIYSLKGDLDKTSKQCYIDGCIYL